MDGVFNVAKKDKVFVKVSFDGVQGSGKTKSALLFAYGLTNDWDDIYALDTENHSVSFYSDLGNFYIHTISPENKNVEYLYGLISYTIEEHWKRKKTKPCIIIDGITPFWEYILEAHDNVAGKDSFANWRKVNPIYQQFVSLIVESHAHVLVTIRQKPEYSREQEIVNGVLKTKVVLIGTKLNFRDSFQYELDISFTIDNETHNAKVTKDRTGVFDSMYQKPELIDSSHGFNLLYWLEENGQHLSSIKSAIAIIEKIESLSKLNFYIQRNQNSSIFQVEEILNLIKLKHERLTIAERDFKNVNEKNQIDELYTKNEKTIKDESFSKGVEKIKKENEFVLKIEEDSSFEQIKSLILSINSMIDFNTFFSMNKDVMRKNPNANEILILLNQQKAMLLSKN